MDPPTRHGLIATRDGGEGRVRGGLPWTTLPLTLSLSPNLSPTSPDDDPLIPRGDKMGERGPNGDSRSAEC